jgi:sortase A
MTSSSIEMVVVGSSESENEAAGSPKRHHIDRRNIIDSVIFLVGLGIFLYPLLVNYLNYRERSAVMDNYDAVVSRLSSYQKAKMWSDAKAYNTELGRPTLRDPFVYKDVKAPLERYFRMLNVDGDGMMAYVDIPKISVKLPVYHGTTDATLLKGTGHIATTHLPTDNNSIHPVITGHTGEPGYIFFDNLTQMRLGDVFQVRVLDHHLSYKVDNISVVLPTDTSKLQPQKGRNYVTLLTCTPYGINSHRLLVRGHFIGENVPATQPSGAPIWMIWILLLLVLVTALAIMRCDKVKRRDCVVIAHRRNQQLSAVAAAVALACGVEADRVDSRGEGKATRRAKVFVPKGFTETARELERRDVEILRRIRNLKVSVGVLSVLAVFFAWGSFGLMMRTGFLPTFDLGYSFFDTHLLYFFGIVG